ATTFKNLYPATKCEVIYCPAAMPELVCHDRAQVRADLSTPENTVLVIQVSRLERWKGQLLHLEALAKLRNLTGWMAWFVGGAQRPPEAHYLEELKSRSHQLKISQRVRFLGQRSDVPRLLAAADIHCQPN